MPVTLPGLSVTKAAELLQTQDKIIKSFPEVASVFGKAGRAETATDPAPLEMFETVINLKPKAEWRAGMTIDKLTGELDRPCSSPASAMPGPCRSRHGSTCWRPEFAHRSASSFWTRYGELEGWRVKSRRRSRRCPARLGPCRTGNGGYFLDVVPDRGKLAQYGVMVEQVQQAVATALGGET